MSNTGRIRCALDEIDEGVILYTLNRAIAAALPLSGGRVRPLLEQLAAELARIDRIRDHAAASAFVSYPFIEPGAGHPFRPGKADSTFGASGTWCSAWTGTTLTGDHCGRPAGDPVHVDQVLTDG